MSVFYWHPKNRNTGKWVCKWTENKKTQWQYFKTEKEAHEFERQRIEKEQSSAPITVLELIALFFQYNQHKSQTYKKLMEYALFGSDKSGVHITGVFESISSKPASQLTRIDLEQIRQHLRAKGSGNNTTNKYQAYMRSILAWGVEMGYISHNPWRDFKRLPVKKRAVQYRLADLQLIYTHAKPWLQWAMKTTLALALRPGKVELFSLTWDAFQWRRGCVQVRQGKTGQIKHVYPPKTYMLEAKKRHTRDLAQGINLVCHKDGKRVISYREAWAWAVKRAGVPHVPMYSIRHIAATEMIAAGADLSSVAAQLGHSTVTTTVNNYAHVTAGGQQRAAETLPELEE